MAAENDGNRTGDDRMDRWEQLLCLNKRHTDLHIFQGDFGKQIEWEGENGLFADENIRTKLKEVGMGITTKPASR